MAAFAMSDSLAPASCTSSSTRNHEDVSGNAGAAMSWVFCNSRCTALGMGRKHIHLCVSAWLHATTDGPQHPTLPRDPLGPTFE